jgi:predicted nucleic acid-binding protein
MPPKPKFFLDTSVCIDVTRGRIPRDEWQRVFRLLLSRYGYAISPLTGYELIAGLATGKQECFDRNREPLRVLYAAGRRQVLPTLKIFVPFQLFGERRRMNASTPNLDLWIRMVLRAKNRADLESGRMKIGAGNRRLGLDLNNMNKQMRDIEDGYAKHFRKFAETQVPDLYPSLWADFVLREYDDEFRLRNRALVGCRTDAAFRFSSSLWQLAKNPSYRIDKYKSDLVDAQQLYYLCDDHLVFLTTDTRLKNKIAGSPQADRVLTWEEAQRLS